MSMDYLVEAMRNKARNDALFANLIANLQQMMRGSGLSELDIVCAARIAAEENCRKEQEDYWFRELRKPFSVPIKPSQQATVASEPDRSKPNLDGEPHRVQ